MLLPPKGRLTNKNADLGFSEETGFPLSQHVYIGNHCGIGHDSCPLLAAFHVE